MLSYIEELGRGENGGLESVLDVNILALSVQGLNSMLHFRLPKGKYRFELLYRYWAAEMDSLGLQSTSLYTGF
jgi:hypothetical protein